MYTQRLPTEVHVVDDDENASCTLSSGLYEDLIMWKFKIKWIGPQHNQKWKIDFPDADHYNHT